MWNRWSETVKERGVALTDETAMLGIAADLAESMGFPSQSSGAPSAGGSMKGWFEHGQPRRSSGPVSLGDLFDQALQRMQVQQPPPAPVQTAPARQNDGLIFSGNRHDSVPRALLTDNRLTPLERNAWQVFRLLLNDDGITALPTYDQLAPWLASMPCATRAHMKRSLAP